LGKDLERKHAEIDQGIESFMSALAAGDRPATVLVEALDELRRHIYFEEELLFPPLHDAGMVPPLFVMRREHGEIWATMDALSDALASDADPGVVPDLVDRLTVQLREHNSKEEMIVYPAADGMIPAPTRDELVAELAEVRMPEQWVCEARR
jgi:iron-sulfur cluster repair protein YtfE (RIC family)